MKKIFIIGIVASGKKTLAKQLSKGLNISWYELDCIVHYDTKEGRKKRSTEEQVEVIKDIDKKVHGYLKAQIGSRTNACMIWQK